MNYIYDILVNFNSNPYDVFEWNKSDKITHIKKIPLIKLNSIDLNNFINKKVKLDNELKDKIYKKTEMYDKKIIDYAFIGTDGKIAVAFKLEKNKLKFSQLFSDEEMEVLDFSYNMKFSKIKYDIIGKNKINYLKTRNEEKMKLYIYKQLSNITNLDKIKFIYLECFGKTSLNPLSDIYKKLENDFENSYIKIYDVLKMITIKK